MTSMTNAHIEIGRLFEAARLKAELDKDAQSHLQLCQTCRDQLSWLQSTSGLGTQEMAYEPPQAVLETVLRMGRPGYLKKLSNFILASLTFDSAMSPAVAGVCRAEAVSREMTFDAGDLEIALSVRRSEGTVSFTGQVLNRVSSRIEDPAARVDLIDEGDHVATTPLSNWGEFAFSDVKDARYSLQIHVLDRVIRIQELPS